jgi:SAM-dependent methyltransferase
MACVSLHQKTTTRSYDTVAAEYLEKTREFSRGLEWIERFVDAVPAGSLVADLGSGPGRDTDRLRSHGLNAFCLDLSLGMLRAGRLDYPASRVQASLLSLPLRSACLGGAWANATLLHLSPPEFRVALRQIHRVLAPSGHLHLTLKLGEGAEWESSRYGLPRWFQYWSGAELDRELDRAGLGPVFSSEEQSSSATWLVRLCRASWS